MGAGVLINSRTGLKTNQHPLPHTERRDPVLEQTVLPKPKETPVQAVPTKGTPLQAFPTRTLVESLPCRQTISAKAFPEVPVAIPIGERKWRHVPCVDHTSTESFEFSPRVVRVSRHSPKLRGLDGAIFRKSLKHHGKEFEQITN